MRGRTRRASERRPAPGVGHQALTSAVYQTAYCHQSNNNHPTLSGLLIMIAGYRPLIVVALFALPCSVLAQRAPGRPIGKVTTIGNLIHLELDPDVISPERLFDLDHR